MLTAVAVMSRRRPVTPEKSIAIIVMSAMMLMSNLEHMASLSSHVCVSVRWRQSVDDDSPESAKSGSDDNCDSSGNCDSAAC